MTWMLRRCDIERRFRSSLLELSVPRQLCRHVWRFLACQQGSRCYSLILENGFVGCSWVGELRWEFSKMSGSSASCVWASSLSLVWLQRAKNGMEITVLGQQ